MIFTESWAGAIRITALCIGEKIKIYINHLILPLKLFQEMSYNVCT
jgi:hypothetical protein